MEQRDYLLRQIDQLGRVLGKILADLLGLKNQGHISEGIAVADQTIRKELDLDIDALTSIPTEKFIETLQEDKKLSNDNFDKLGDILFLLAEELDDKGTDSEKKKKLFEKTLAIYEHLDKTDSTYSFDRHLKIEKIKNAL